MVEEEVLKADDKAGVSVGPAEVDEGPVGELRVVDVVAVAPLVEADIVDVELTEVAFAVPDVEENMLEGEVVKTIGAPVVLE